MDAKKKQILIAVGGVAAAAVLSLIVLDIIIKVKEKKATSTPEGENEDRAKDTNGNVIHVQGTDRSTTVENPSGTLYIFPMQWGSGLWQYCKKPTISESYVRALQTICKCYGLLTAADVDGKWGDDTEEAVQKLQRLVLWNKNLTIKKQPFAKYISNCNHPLASNSKVAILTLKDFNKILHWHNDNVDDTTHQLTYKPH